MESVYRCCGRDELDNDSFRLCVDVIGESGNKTLSVFLSLENLNDMELVLVCGEAVDAVHGVIPVIPSENGAPWPCGPRPGSFLEAICITGLAVDESFGLTVTLGCNAGAKRLTKSVGGKGGSSFLNSLRRFFSSFSRSFSSLLFFVVVRRKRREGVDSEKSSVFEVWGRYISCSGAGRSFSLPADDFDLNLRANAPANVS